MEFSSAFLFCSPGPATALTGQLRLASAEGPTRPARQKGGAGGDSGWNGCQPAVRTRHGNSGCGGWRGGRWSEKTANTHTKSRQHAASNYLASPYLMKQTSLYWYVCTSSASHSSQIGPWQNRLWSRPHGGVHESPGQLRLVSKRADIHFYNPLNSQIIVANPDRGFPLRLAGWTNFVWSLIILQCDLSFTCFLLRFLCC